MTSLPQRLIQGYRTFLGERLPTEQHRFRELAERGQKPEIMVIGCCDSRVSPEVIFDARPGELFVVRNVANLVPPYAPDGAYHGVSSALEYAVQALKVKHIVVLGHAGCGGVQAFVENAPPLSPGDFISKWLELMAPAVAKCGLRGADRPFPDYQTRIEHASVLCGLDNLMTFPCIRILVERGTLSLHAAYFGVATGELTAWDPDTGTFLPVAPREHAEAFSAPRF